MSLVVNRELVDRLIKAGAIAGLVSLIMALMPLTLAAKSESGTKDGLQRYIIQLQDPPLAAYDGRKLSVANKNGQQRLAATAPRSRGQRRLDTRSAESRAYLEFMTERHDEFKAEASLVLNRKLAARQRYRFAMNGMAMDLYGREARALAKSPLVKSIKPDVRHRLETFAGPPWLGSAEIWDGKAVFPGRAGENVIVGIIDSGINWDHPSFDDPAPDYNHSNPLGTRLGLCSDPEVNCNDKLIGVYDFVEDDPLTEDVVEENTKGRDNDGHGSHVASIAAGNKVNLTLNGQIDTTVSGVAPRANIIAYRVCHVGDPPASNGGGCSESAVLAAIDQAIDDGVDVLNYSIGTTFATNPWGFSSESRAFLNAREAGIFVATSAGNTGPNDSTIGSPANAPWIVSVGNATHNVLFGSTVKNMVGGATEAPDDIVGASLTSGTGQLVMVHAKDYGFPLCGVGSSESEATCAGNTGATNPWAGQPVFNGQIVVCDRGDYGRVEKGKNVLLAGAGGYILANTAEFGESLVADDHCLPAAHVGETDGDVLRAWLDSGTGHGGALSGLMLVEKDELGDQVSSSSSRGPVPAPVENTLKPNLIAPGTSILAAWMTGSEFRELSGTSMASPHVAGSAALLKSVHLDWGPNELSSAIETTASTEFARDYDNGATTPFDVGAGRPQLDQAVDAGLFLDVQPGEFNNANPAAGGDPRSLNLPGLVDDSCQVRCSFSRTVTDLMGGGDWTASAEGFPESVQVSVSPADFQLGDGDSQQLEIEINVESSDIVGSWVSGSIQLTAAGSPDQFLTVYVYSDGGDLPSQWTINDDRNGGWMEFQLSGLVALPDGTYSSGKMVMPTRTVETVPDDPTEEDPYNGAPGVFTKWHSLPQGALWLYAETLTSTAVDLDLFVGRDVNGNNRADDFEELCSSQSSNDLERCDLFNLEPGNYWVLVQNWDGNTIEGDEATLLSAAVERSEDSKMAASGPGIVGKDDALTVRVSWDNVDALPGETWLSAVGIGTERENPGNVGVIPVRFNRTGIASDSTFPLMDGMIHRLALDANGKHDEIFIDIPPGSSSLTVTANGADDDQDNGLTLELVRLDFADGLSNPPFAAPAGNAPVVASASGANGQGPSVTVNGADLQPGRWYAVLHNGNNSPSAVNIRADVEFSGTPIPVFRGIWEPNSRPQINQGYETHDGDPSRMLIWYTYDEDGQPVWFYADGPNVDGNIWTADIWRLTNDGAEQQYATVGKLSVTTLAEKDQLFSFTLYGESGTDRLQPLGIPTCPQVNGSEKSYNGHWYRGSPGLGGASIHINSMTQFQVRYIYDDKGMPRWLVAQDDENPQPGNESVPLLQTSGFCPTCSGQTSLETVGVLERHFYTESEGDWTLDYLLLPPLSGSAQRMEQSFKLTAETECE